MKNRNITSANNLQIKGFTFDPLWRTLKSRAISSYSLEYEYNLNPWLINRLHNNHNFTLYSIIEICNMLHIYPTEMLEFITNEEQQPEISSPADISPEPDLSEHYVHIGVQIRYYRKLRGLSQEEFAESLGISLAALACIEDENTVFPITLEFLFKAADTLDVEVFRFLQYS